MLVGVAVGMHTKWEFGLSSAVTCAAEADTLADRVMGELAARAGRGELDDPAAAPEFDRRVILVEMLVYGSDRSDAAHRTNATMGAVLEAAGARALMAPISTEIIRITA